MHKNDQTSCGYYILRCLNCKNKSIVICFKDTFLYFFAFYSVAIANYEHETNYPASTQYQHTAVLKVVESSQIQNKHSVVVGVFFFYFFAAYHVSEAFARRYSVKNVFLKISQNSPENTCARVSFLINLQSSPPVAASDTSPISRSISACIYWTTDNAEQVSSSTRDE